MQFKYPALLLVILLFTSSGYGQKETENLSGKISGSYNSISKLYIHTDRSVYHAGQTIWLKGYLLNDFLPDTISSVMYVEIINKDLKLFKREVFPVFNGISTGQIEIPSEISEGNYLLRAYTSENSDLPANHYLKTLIIYGKRAGAVNKISGSKEKIHIRFFPEGGNFVTGLVNNIAFKASDTDGLPININGILKDSNGEILSEIITLHNGMGKFSLRPLPGQTYYLEVKGMENQPFKLPQASEEGINILVNQTLRSVNFRIEQLAGTKEEKKVFSIKGRMQSHIVFEKKIDSSLNTFSGVLPTTSLPSGILILTIYNKDNIPLGERLVFINNDDYKVNADLILDTQDVRPYKPLKFNLKFTDTIAGSFSISITDADYDLSRIRPENILSCLLLTSELKGYIHEPSYYFLSSEDSVRQHLDLVMLTNGWRSYSWVEKEPDYNPMQPYISLKGKIINEYNKKPFSNESFFLLMKNETDSSKSPGEIKMFSTDEEGRFNINPLIFPGNMKLSFYKYPKDSRRKIKVIFDSDSLHAYKAPPLPEDFHYPSTEINNLFSPEIYSGYIDENAEILQEVVVSGRIKTEIQKLDEIYTTGYFRGGATTKSLDVREEISSENVFDFIRNRIPGVSVELDTGAEGMGSYVVKLRQQNSEHWPNPPLTIYLNEMPTSSVFVEAIPLNQIAYVKVFPTFTGNVGNLGALAIYTKNFDHLPNNSSAFNTYYKGYSVIKEFYQPDYSLKPPENADNRITLFWKPDIFIADINPQIPVEWYNNSRTKRFKIIIEGFTREGKILMIEKIIE